MTRKLAARVCSGTAALLLAVVLPGRPVLAQADPDALQKLLQRVDQLEKRLAEQEARNAQLEAKLVEMQNAQTPGAQPQAQARVAEPQKGQGAPAVQGQAAAPAPQAKTAPERQPVLAKSNIDLYGYVKLDGSYDTGRIYPGNYALYVQPLPANGRNNSQTDVTANQSRFGLAFKGPDAGGVKTSGRAEIDFYGGGAENKSNPMMRLAYLQVEWPSGFGILAGQAADIISPLVEPTVNYTVGWDAGNIGYRRPQLRLFQDIKTGEGSKFSWQFGFSRTIGRTLNEHNSGVDAGFPTAQARLAFAFPGAAGRATTLGISGHYGTELFIPPETTKPDQRYHSYSVGLDASIPLGSKVTLQAEAYSGQDLDSYFGGSNEAINFTRKLATHAAGGWVALSAGPYERWTFNLGAGVDDPRNADLSEGSRSRNENVFGNVYYNVTKAVQFELEVSYWGTEYLGKPNVHALRGQLAFQYNF